MKQKELTVTLHIGGKQVDFLTDEQRDKMARSLSDTMSRYYSVNLDEFSKLSTKK